MFKVPEKARITNELARKLRLPMKLGSEPSDGNNGFFIFKFAGYEVRVKASDSKEWKSIVGYEGLYEISNYGEVKALVKDIDMTFGGKRHHEENILSKNENDEYPRVSLSKDSETKKFLVHRLVAEHFINNLENYPIVNHIDGDKHNNIVTNLEWCSHEYNLHHSIENGMRMGIKTEDIILIKELLEKGEQISDIASIFNKPRQTIFDIRAGRHRDINNNSCSKYDGLSLWEHCSVSINRERTPTWEVMCAVKDLFWDAEDTVIQFHPKKSDYVNNHPHVLHLWRPTDKEIELPDSTLVGIEEQNIN